MSDVSRATSRAGLTVFIPRTEDCLNSRLGLGVFGARSNKLDPYVPRARMFKPAHRNTDVFPCGAGKV